MARGNPIVHARRGSGASGGRAVSVPNSVRTSRPVPNSVRTSRRARGESAGAGRIRARKQRPGDPVGANCPGLAVASEVPSAVGGGPPGHTIPAFQPRHPRRGALQAQQRRHPRRVAPLALLDLGNPAPNGPSDDQRLRGWGSHGCRGHPFRPVSPTCTAGSAPRPLVTVSPSAWSRSISRSLALAAVFVVALALRVIRLPRASNPRAAVAIQRCRDSSQCSPPSPRLRRAVTTRPGGRRPPAPAARRIR